MRTAPRILPLVALVALECGIAVSVAAGEDSGYEIAVSSGEPVSRGAFSDHDLDLFDSSGATGSVTKIGVQKGMAFFAIDVQSGGRCYGFGADQPGVIRLGAFGCMPTTAARQPYIDLSIVTVDPSTRAWSFRVLQGIAADGVGAIGIVDEDGRRHTTPVVGNTYRMTAGEVPQGQPTELVALDASGRQMHSTLFTGG